MSDMGEAFVKSIFTTFFSCGLNADIMVTTLEGVESCSTGISIGTFLTKSCNATFSSFTTLFFLFDVFCFLDLLFLLVVLCPDFLADFFCPSTLGVCKAKPAKNVMNNIY